MTGPSGPGGPPTTDPTPTGPPTGPGGPLAHRRPWAPPTPYRPAGSLGPTGAFGTDGKPGTGNTKVMGRRRVRLKSHTDSLWRGGRLIIKGRVYGVFSSASSPRTVALQIRTHGHWSTAARPRLDKRGRFSTRPHLRRARRATHGHSRLMIGRGYVPFRAKSLRVRARVSDGSRSTAVVIQLRR